MSRIVGLHDAIWQLNQTSISNICVMIDCGDNSAFEITNQVMRHYNDMSKATAETMYYFEDCYVDSIMLNLYNIAFATIYIKESR